MFNFSWESNFKKLECKLSFLFTGSSLSSELWLIIKFYNIDSWGLFDIIENMALEKVLATILQ